MVDRGGKAPLDLEALAKTGVRSQFGPDDLERDHPFDLRLDGAVDAAHPALAAQLDHSVTGQGSPDSDEGHGVVIAERRRAPILRRRTFLAHAGPLAPSMG